MISLRSLTSLTAVAVAALVFTACSDLSTSPQRANGPQPGNASRDGKVGDTGNAAKHGSIDVRVLRDKNQHALLEVHTGTFDENTGIGTANGYFQSIQYKVYDASGKQVQVKNVHFDQTGVTRYLAPIDLCTNSDDHEEDDDATACTTQFGAGWTVSVQANLKGVIGDDDKTDVVRGNGIVEYLPDIDMTQQGLFVVGTGGLQTPASTVTPAVVTTFSVPIPNNKPIAGQPNSVGVIATCLVTVDGTLQLAVPNGTYDAITNPNAFGYVGNPTQTIAAGATGACQFTLTLAAGTHHISVTAVVLYPGDYDPSNNTTATFTVNAVTGGPDIAAGLLQQNLGTGPTALGKNPIYTGIPIELDQWVSLISGTPPGTVTCTVTLINTATNVALPVLTATVSLTTPYSSAACKLPITFTAPGTYTAVSTVVTAPGIIDPVPTNNVVTNTIVVLPPPPSAIVTVAALSFTDAAEKISGQQFSPSLNSAADTVHSGDVVTYTAAINIASLQNALNVPAITCSATLDGVDVTNSVTWITKTVSSATSASAPACSFALKLIETDNLLHPHVIGVSINTGTFTNLAATGTTLTGTINAVRRVDVAVGALQVVGTGGATTSLTSTPIKQGTTVTLSVPITNLSALGSTVVNCGPLVDNVVAPTTFAIPQGDTVPTLLTPTSVGATQVSLAPNATGACTYTISAPPSLGLIAMPLVAGVTTVAGNPLDPDPSNNWSTGTLTVISNGQFTTLPAPTSASALRAYQTWYTTGNTGSLDSLTQQGLDIKDLALLLIPTQSVLGTFALSGTVTSGLTDQVAFGTGQTGTVTAPIALSETVGPGQTCVPFPLTSGLNQQFANPVEPQLRYSAIICSEQAAQAGYQQLVISYSQSIASTVPGSLPPLMFADHITVKIALHFTITGAAQSDMVTATVTIPVGSYGCGALSGDANAPQICSSNFGTFAITTP